MKSRCRSIQRQLSDYMDCTLSGRQTVIVAQHLRSCKACQRELESLRRSKRLLHFYAYPSPPKDYYNQFWGQLQRTIEKHPHPAWWRATALQQALSWRLQECLTPFVWFWDRLVRLPASWVKLSPIYAWTLFVALLVYQFLQPQQQNPTDTANLRSALSGFPVHLTIQGSRNRELVSSRGRLIGLSLSSPKQFQETQKLSGPFDTADASSRVFAWAGHLPSLVNDSDALTAAARRDTSPDLMTTAQLSIPEPIATHEEVFQPLRVVINPFPREVGWGGHRSLNGFVDMLMNVPLPSLSITEVYDSIKL